MELGATDFVGIMFIHSKPSRSIIVHIQIRFERKTFICDFCISTHSFDWILFILQIIFNLHGVEEFLLKVQFHWSHLNTFLFAAFNTRSFGNFSFMSVRIQFFFFFQLWSYIILSYFIFSGNIFDLECNKQIRARTTYDIPLCEWQTHV